MNVDWEARARAAERTVEVLARKVMALYRGEGSSTIQRQLERARQRQERALQRRRLTEVRAVELARYSEGLEVEVAERTRALRTILDHVTSGLLVIDADLVVGAGHSRSCHALFGAEVVAGASLIDLLGITAARAAASLRVSVDQVFCDLLPEEVSLEMIPRRFALGGRILHVDARVIRRDGEISGLLLTVSDVSNLERAEREAHENQALLYILKGRDAFREFVVDARALLAAARDAARDRNHAFVRRAVHTIKGNAATFDLTEVVALVHAIESHASIDAADLGLVERALCDFLARHATLLEIDYGGTLEETFEVAASTMGELRSLAASGEVTGRAVERWSAQVTLKRADALLAGLGPYVTKLGERLEKCVDFQLHGGETLVDAHQLRPVFQNLTHVLRNAVDHGVEGECERGDKPSRATVRVAVAETPDAWHVDVSDDGRGVDTEAVVAQAVARGIVSAERAEGMNERERLELVFADGLSTASRTTDVSGRGVGMSAMRAAVHERGGTIALGSTRGVGTRIAVVVPKPAALRSSPSRAPGRAA